MEPTPLPDLASYLAQPGEADAQLRRLFPRNAPLTIFDIGSCEGEDSIRYSRCFPRARIFAFEPLPANQDLIRANLRHYAADRVELVPLALSDHTGEATFHVSSGRPTDEFAGKDWNYGNKSSSLLPPAQREAMYGWVEFKEAITVRTDTLEHFCAERRIERIDFIHLDVQGAEHLVLAGAGERLRQTTALWLEVSEQELYAGQKLRPDMETFLRARGFALGHEVRRELEGDQFYVNTHHARTWPYLAARRTGAALARVRHWAGRFKRRLRG